MCGIAWSGLAEDCRKDSLLYAYQCMAKSGGSGSYYLREDYTCSAKEVYLSGPCIEGVPRAMPARRARTSDWPPMVRTRVLCATQGVLARTCARR